MAGRSWKQAVKEDLTPELKSMLAEAADNIRHKVIEQAWFGQEQTGYIQNPYGSQEQGNQPVNNFYTTINVNEQQSTDESQAEDAHVPAGDWQGEHQGPYGGASDPDRRPRNGWDLGQNPNEPTRQEQASIEQEKGLKEQGLQEQEPPQQGQ